MKAQWDGWKSPLAASIKRFLVHKRALGRRYDNEEKALRLLDRFLVRRRVTSLEEITPELLDEFLASRPRTRPRSYNALLGVLRVLFAWLVTQESLADSPVRARARRNTGQRIPYLFDAAYARRLLDIAGSLPDNSRAPLRGPTYRIIFALLYGLGLRVSEVARLQRGDVDFDRQLLVVRGAKFGKSRLVPFGPRLGERLRQYVGLRERQGGGSLASDTPVFSFTRRGHVHPGTISQTFHQLIPRLGLTIPSGVAPPHVHDLRHAFAVGTLLRWYRAGLDPAGRLFHLATFLGHVSPSSTAVYLTITDALLDEANRRFANLAGTAMAEMSP
jgi:site-specific recombinase XerD